MIKSIKNFSAFKIVLIAISIFLMLITFNEFYQFWFDDIVYAAPYMYRPLWSLFYLLFWIQIIAGKKWGMYGFVAMTAISWGAHFAFPNNDYVLNTLSVFQETIPLNIILSIIILLYFKNININKEESN